jgi:hypothetical protein
LILIALWAALALLCAGAGLALMGPAATLFVRTWDRFLFASFLGLAAIGAVLLAWSLVAPVTPWALILCAAVALAGGVAQPAARASVLKILTDLNLAALATGIVLAVLFAERSTAAGDLNDAGAYHVGIVRWLSEVGTVHGIALIQARFGFVSSWLAWSAAFDHGDLAGRIGTVMNGFLLLLCLGQLLLVTLRMWRNQREASDFLVLLAWLILLPSILGWDMRSSPSPDIPLFVFGVVIAWAMLVIESQAKSQPAASRARFMVLLLGAGAFLMKLSGAPLLAASALYFVWAQPQGRFFRLGAAGVACTTFLGLLALAGLVSSGCAFFPWPRLCADLPWSVGRDGAQVITDVIRRWAWGTLDQPELHGMALLTAWIKSNADSARWIALSLVAAVWLLLRRNRLNVAGLGWASAISIIGLPFLLFTAPAGRFGTTYLILLPLLALLTLRAPLADMCRRIAGPVALRRLAIAVTALGALHIALPLYKEFINSKLRAMTYESLAHRKQGDPAANAFNARWWLVPNRYADLPGFTAARAYDFDYSVPPTTTALCWHHALPCTYENLAHVRLRNAALGLSAGFEREPGTAPERKRSG